MRCVADPDVRFARTYHNTGSGKTPRAVCRDSKRCEGSAASERSGSLGRMVASIRRPNRPPYRRGLRGFGIARREKHLHLMGRQRLGRRVLAGRPPAKSPAGKPLVAKPKTLAVIDQVSSSPSPTGCETRTPSR